MDTILLKFHEPSMNPQRYITLSWDRRIQSTYSRITPFNDPFEYYSDIKRKRKKKGMLHVESTYIFQKAIRNTFTKNGHTTLILRHT